MNLRRLTASAVAVISLNLTGGAVLAAGPDMGNYDTTWTVTAALCDQLPAGSILNGTGEGHFVSNVRQTNSGRTHVRSEAHASGSAIDQDGNEYRWNYTNVVVGEVVDGVVYASMVDTFVVTGSGPASYVTGFTADFVEVPGVSFDIEARHVLGDPFDFANDSGRCDPI